MAKYRVWSGEEPCSDDKSGVLKSTSSISDAIKYIRKHSTLEEDSSGLQELLDGSWDEWLDAWVANGDMHAVGRRAVHIVDVRLRPLDSERGL